MALLQAIVWLKGNCTKKAKASKEDEALAAANNKANREQGEKG